MGALPKQRVSKTKRGFRRQHQKLTAPHLMRCPNCRDYTRPHHVCMSCGYYAGRQVVEIELRMPSQSNEGQAG